MDATNASALSALRSFNYDYIYNRPDSIAQGRAVIDVLTALVDYFIANPATLPSSNNAATDVVTAAVTYVAGMTDRYAFDTAVQLLDWPADRRPLGIDVHG